MRYASPLSLPKGTTLSMRFTYDNSDQNPNNRRRPARHVSWGPQSSDEMGALWLEVLPRHAADRAVLMRDYARRAMQADISAAELQARTNPGAPFAHNFLAARYLQAGRIAEAVAELDEALRLKPDDAEAHSNLGIAFQLQGRLGDAVRELREAARLKPNDDRVHVNLGNVMQAGGRADAAVSEYRRAIALNPENADAHFNLAVILGPRGQLAEAILHLRRAAVINPQNADVHRNLGLALSLQGKTDEAIEALQEALRIQPDSLEAQKTLAAASTNVTASGVASPEGRRVGRIWNGLGTLRLVRARSAGRSAAAISDREFVLRKQVPVDVHQFRRDRPRDRRLVGSCARYGASSVSISTAPRR